MILSFLYPPPTTALYPLSLHDALPISKRSSPEMCEPRPIGRPSTTTSTMPPRVSPCFFAFSISEIIDSSAALSKERTGRSEEHTSELQSRFDLVCRLLLEKKKIHIIKQ